MWVLYFLLVVGGSCLIFPTVAILRKNYKERIEQNREAKEKQEEQILQQLMKEIANTFHFDLSGVREILEDIHEIYVQDEIVRFISLLACEVAEACVNQDKANRGETQFYHLGQETSRLKAKWSKARMLALLIAPELANRLPHFSEFEPLKSYMEEHILQKKAKSK